MDLYVFVLSTHFPFDWILCFIVLSSDSRLIVTSGPNWIHGTGTNPILSIANATQTVTHDPEGRNIAISRDGQLLGEDAVTKASEFMWATIEQAFEYSSQHGGSIPPERSLYDFFVEKLEQTDFSEEEKQLCLDSCKLWGAYVGDPVERQSLKFFCLEQCIDGGAYSDSPKRSTKSLCGIYLLTSGCRQLFCRIDL